MQPPEGRPTVQAKRQQQVRRRPRDAPHVRHDAPAAESVQSICNQLVGAATLRQEEQQGGMRMADKKPGDFANVDSVSEHVAQLVDGWASVIRCKAESYGGPRCDRIIMTVFLDF